jgi:UDP-N-acetyl-D-mannosaminuronate dehydrogenase
MENKNTDTFNALIDVLIEDIVQNRTQYTSLEVLEMLKFIKNIYRINIVKYYDLKKDGGY